MKKKPYTCPRCLYQTMYKSDMHKHLYKLKKLCPAQESNVELTDDIKKHVLENRVYVVEEPVKQNTIINNYHNVNNFIAGIDVLDKLAKYIKHKNIDIMGFEQAIEHRYSKTVERLESDTWKYGFELKTDDLLDVIDQVSKVNKVKSFEDLNIYYDKNSDKLKIYDGEWEEMLIHKGVKKILETIQSYYWDVYEGYLLKKYHRETNSYNRQKYSELLVEYYKFIGCFDVEPYIKNKDDETILGVQGATDFTICDEIYPMYIKTRDNIKKSDINEVKKMVLDIIRKNSNRNVTELNKRIFELFTIDEDFKNQFINVSI